MCRFRGFYDCIAGLHGFPFFHNSEKLKRHGLGVRVKRAGNSNSWLIHLDSSPDYRDFIFGSKDGVDVEAEPFRHAITISGVGFIKVADLQFLDAPCSLTEAADDVVDQSLLRSDGHEPK